MSKEQNENPKNSEEENHQNDINKNIDDDIFKFTNEIKYHNLKKYKSAGVFENEKTVIDEIIEYKKSKNLEYDYYEKNKNFIDMAISKMQTDIICGVLTLDAYKLQVKKQLVYEETNLEEAKKDKNLLESEKEKILERMNKRIEILNSELLQKVEENEEQEELENNNDENTQQAVANNLDSTDINKKQEDKSNILEPKANEEEKKIFQGNSLDREKEQLAEEEIKEAKEEKPKEKDNLHLAEKLKDFIEESNNKLNEDKNEQSKVIISAENINTTSAENETNNEKNPFKPNKSSNTNLITIPESKETQTNKTPNNSESTITTNNTTNNSNTHNDNNNNNNYNKIATEQEYKSFIRQNSLLSNSTIISNINNINYNTENLQNNLDFQKSLKENVIYQILKVRFREYKAAYKYYRINYCSKQENDAIKKASFIQKCIKALESGHDVDESLVPIGVNPEYIYDCSKKERHEIYSKLIKEINKNKKECLDKRNKIMADFQKMAKKDQIKKQEEIKKTILENDAKIKGFDSQIKRFMLEIKNQWIPPPQYAFLEEEEKKERILIEIPENHLLINLESCNYDKQDAYCYICLDLGDNRKLGEWVYINQFPKTILWAIDKKDQYTLFKRTVEIVLYRTHWYWPFQYSQKGELKIKLESLKCRCEIKDKFNINLVSKRRTVDFDISIGLRTPLHEKEFITILHPKISITKVFTEFKLPEIQDFDEEEENESRVSIISHKNNNNHNNNREIVNTNSHNKDSIKPKNDENNNYNNDTDSIISKKNPKEEQKDKATEKQEDNNSNAKEATANTEKIDPAQFAKDELDDPEVIENLISMKVLELKVQKLDLEIKKIEGRTPSDLRRKFLNTKVRWNCLKEAIEEGNLSLKDYIVLLQKQIEKDKKLKAYFIQVKETKKAAIVNERLIIMVKELKEAMEHGSK